MLRYKQRPGTSDSGRDYEFKMLSILSLRCALKKSEDMWLAFNVDGVGDFDDIVLCTRESETTFFTTFMLQLKHKDNPKKLTKEEFMPTTKKGDFSLTKYAEGFTSLKKELEKRSSDLVRNVDPENTYFVLFTNRDVNKYEFLESDPDDRFSVLNTNSRSESTFRFNFAMLKDGESLPNADYCKNIRLVPNQISVKHIDDQIIAELEKLIVHFGLKQVNNIKGIADNLTKYIIDWSKGNLGGHYFLKKANVLRKLAELFLNQYEIDLKQERFIVSNLPQRGIWNEIIGDKIVTVVDSDDTIHKYLVQHYSRVIKEYSPDGSVTWSHKLSDESHSLFYKNFPDLKTEMLKLVGNHGKITILDIYRCVWFSNRVPMLLQINNVRDFHDIRAILEMSSYTLRAIVVKTPDVTLLDTGGIPTYFATLKDLSNEHKAKILSQAVKIQGRQSVPLEGFIHESAQELIKCNDIIHILSDDFSIGNDYEHLPDCLVERSLSRVLLRREVLTTVKNDSFFMESGFSFTDEENLIAGANENREALEKRKGDRNALHRLIYHDSGFLEWKESFGSIGRIRQFHAQEIYESWFVKSETLNTSQTVSNLWVRLEDLLENEYYWKTAHVVSADPGMGKSILMSVIASRAPADLWVLKINLNDHEDYYENLENTRLGASDHLKHFSDALLEMYGCPNKELAQVVFQQLLDAKKIMVLLDGFDEISTTFKEEVTRIVGCLHQEGLRLWITTRPIMKSHLEDLLNTMSITLKPFTVKDQEGYLVNHFRAVPGGDCPKILTEFVKELLKAARFNLCDAEWHFTEVPLQTKLLADVFVGDYKASVKTDSVCFKKTFDLLYLYEEFMKQKLDILCHKFGRDAKRTRVLFKEYQQLFALKLLFFSADLLGLNVEDKLQQCYEDNKNEMKFLQREGVVVVHHERGSKETCKVKFVHRTFADYLAAQWLSEHFNDEDQTIRNVAQRLMEKRYGDWKFHPFLFRLFDRILTKGCPYHLCVINGQTGDLKSGLPCWGNAGVTDRGGRTVLHMIALYGLPHPQYYDHARSFEDPLANIVDEIGEGEGLMVIDEISGYSPLDYALLSTSLAVANKFCEMWPHLAINIDMPSFRKERSFKHCILLDYRALFRTLLLYFASRDMLIQNVPGQVAIESFCNRFNDQDLNTPKFYDYMSELGVKTISELFKFEYREAGSPVGQYYADLRFAVSFGSLDNVRFLLDQGADTNKEDVDGNTPLHYAAKRGRTEIVTVLLSEGAEVDKPNLGGCTALHYAAMCGDNETVTELLCYGFDVNKATVAGNTPVHFAIGHKHVDTVNLLLLNGADSHIESTDGNTLLHYAAREGFCELILQLLCTDKATVNKQNNRGSTPLHLALISNHSEAAALLMSQGADCNTEDANGNIPLHCASNESNGNLVAELICRTADINKQNKKGATPLLLALNHINVLKLLVSGGASCNVEDHKGNSPLHLAAEQGSCEVVSELLDAGANIDKENSSNATPLHSALLRHHTDTADLLISRDANIHLKDSSGFSPLHYAASSGNTEIVQKLLLKGADINALTTLGNSPLKCALSWGKVETAKVLLCYGADGNIESASGISCLHCAAHIGNTEIMSQLLNEGAAVNIQSKDGDTPLHAAAKRGWADAVQLLLDNSADVSVQNQSGKTPLHASVVDIALSDDEGIERQKFTINLLLDRGADTNIQDADGNTALHHASKNKSRIPTSPNVKEKVLNFYDDVVLKLLEAGADISMTNNDRKTALDMANEAKYSNIVFFLRQRGLKCNPQSDEG